ncbi:MAG: hypothetical protein VKP62_06030 [Candidatus Sericytochromatia bacterium]|nr:hypothetical protein [Candidatus Sericytochromatia bacterium]
MSKIVIACPTSDLPGSEAFYQALLGIAPARRLDGSRAFEGPDFSLILEAQSASVSTTVAAGLSFGLQLGDRQALQAARERLRGCDATVVEEVPGLVLRTWAPDGRAWRLEASRVAPPQGPLFRGDVVIQHA